MAQNATSCRKKETGWLSTNLTVLVSTTMVLLMIVSRDTPANGPADSSILICLSIEYLTTVALKGVPSENLTFGLRVKVQIVPLVEVVQTVARAGTMSDVPART